MAWKSNETPDAAATTSTDDPSNESKYEWMKMVFEEAIKMKR